MRIVMSMWTKPCIDGKSHGFSSIENMIESTIVACNVVKQQYDDIHFYTDERGYEWIKPYLKKLPFSKIEVVLDNINWLSDDFWSLCKLYVYSLQNKPFIHIDNDVFIWEKIPDNLLKSDFLFQEIEYHELGCFFYKEAFEFYKKNLPKEIKYYNGAFNCGVFGCLTKEALLLLKKYYEIAFNFIKKAKEIPETSDGIKRKLSSVFIEQQFIYSLILDKGYSFETLKNHILNNYKIKYTHELSHHKRNPIVENMIKDRIYFEDWK